MTKPWRIVGAGEVLWDVFPKSMHFGGAPANFCCLAKGIGTKWVESLIVSAVGKDELGDRAATALAEREVDVTYLQRNDFPTGRVLVTLDDHGTPSYSIEERVAWDYLRWTDELDALASTVHVVCFGTLGQRQIESREVIRAFVRRVPPSALRVLDLNLRHPYVDSSIIEESLAMANLLKLNSDELRHLQSMLQASGDPESFLRQLQQRYDFEAVIVTHGSEGSLVMDREGRPHRKKPEAVEVVDTVGAGDSFTAAFCLNLLAGRSMEEAHEHAVRVASYVCSRPGATPMIPAKWQWNDTGS